MKNKKTLGIIFIAILAGGSLYFRSNSTSVQSKEISKTPPISIKAVSPNQCAKSTEPQTIIVSISQRHLWACEEAKTVYDTAVVTGDMNIPADLTPIGTYKVYAKQTNRYLTGSDEKGSWNVYVSYWMPFLDNKYGTYGFHDATWRKDGDFGSINPYSSDASHGCVELPLKAQAWIYDWGKVGTIVTIIS